MKIIEITKAALSAIVDFVTSKYKLRLLLIILLMCGAITDFIINGQSRRTFIFYDYVNENVIVEDRMFKRSSCRETALRRYIEEALLGPITQDFVPLFPREIFSHRGLRLFFLETERRERIQSSAYFSSFSNFWSKSRETTAFTTAGSWPRLSNFTDSPKLVCSALAISLRAVFSAREKAAAKLRASSSAEEGGTEKEFSAWRTGSVCGRLRGRIFSAQPFGNPG